MDSAVGARHWLPGAVRAPYGDRMDDGVESAHAASSLARLSSRATLLLLREARLVRIPAGAVTHRDGETAEHPGLVVDGLVQASVAMSHLRGEPRLFGWKSPTSWSLCPRLPKCPRPC